MLIRLLPRPLSLFICVVLINLPYMVSQQPFLGLPVVDVTFIYSALLFPETTWQQMNNF